MINLELQRRIEEAKRRANGHWMSLLERLSVDHKVLGKRNQPCPGCGGKDRFQFTDKYGDGNYICRGCGPGDGFALLELCLGWKLTDALKAVESMVGSSFHESKPAPCGPSPQRMRKLAKSIWQEANPVEAGDAVATYLWVAKSQSSGDGSLKQSVAMLAPSVMLKGSGSRGGCAGALRGRRPIERAVDAKCVVIVREFAELARQVYAVPEEKPIEVFTPNRPNKPFYERVRDRNVRNRFDLFDLKDAQIGEPSMESKKWVVIGTGALGQTLARDCAIEQPAGGDAIDVGGFDTEADDAAAENVHDQHDPMAAQEDRFAAE